MTVLEQILTGTFADGLGNVKKDANRVDFDPFPYESFAVWILTQMKRWGQIKGDVDYAGVAKQVFLATDTTKLMKEVGLTPPAATSKSFVVMGKTFDPEQARGIREQLRDQAGSCDHNRVSCPGSHRMTSSSLTPAARALRVGAASSLAFLLAWHLAVRGTGTVQQMDPEYAKLMGMTATQGKSAMPGPLDVGAKLWEHLSRPFYDNGPNDKGVGIQLGYSIARVRSAICSPCWWRSRSDS